MKASRVWVSVCVLVGLLAATTSAVTIDTVPVGNPGNAMDTEVMMDGTTGYGSVSYTYRIGKYEVTAGQYCEFLNSVAKTDPYGLYSPNMNSTLSGCRITQNGSDGNYTYDFSGGTVEVPGSTAEDWENRPVNFVTWGDATRFANWMHNGQPSGMLTGNPAQDAGLTEEGSYYLNGATTDATLVAVSREADATWVIPSEDEWYKAAYHKNDGVTGDYFDYPTSNDNIPSNDLIDPDPGNNATFYDIGFTIGSPYDRTEVGAHENSGSPYGTFDQGGNVSEWNEAVIGSSRSVRGGCFFNYEDDLHAVSRGDSDPTKEFFNLGFRVAQVPEPATILAFAASIPILLKRKRKSRS